LRSSLNGGEAIDRGVWTRGARGAEFGRGGVRCLGPLPGQGYAPLIAAWGDVARRG